MSKTDSANIKYPSKYKRKNMTSKNWNVTILFLRVFPTSFVKLQTSFPQGVRTFLQGLYLLIHIEKRFLRKNSQTKIKGIPSTNKHINRKHEMKSKCNLCITFLQSNHKFPTEWVQICWSNRSAVEWKNRLIYLKRKASS